MTDASQRPLEPQACRGQALFQAVDKQAPHLHQRMTPPDRTKVQSGPAPN